MTCGIYEIYFNGSEKTYIGSSKNIEKRVKDHIRKLTCGKHPNSKLQSAYRRYGTPSSRVIEECGHGALFEREQHYIDVTGCAKSGYNICEQAGKVPSAVAESQHYTHKYDIEIREIVQRIVDHPSELSNVSSNTGMRLSGKIPARRLVVALRLALRILEECAVGGQHLSHVCYIGSGSFSLGGNCKQHGVFDTNRSLKYNLIKDLTDAAAGHRSTKGLLNHPGSLAVLINWLYGKFN